MRALFVLFLAVVLTGCDSDSDKACHDVGNCSHGGSDAWVTACSDQADALADEAAAVGCQPQFEAYFSCAEDRFECTGNRSSFPGCEAKLDAYSACLATKESGTACVALENELAACDPGSGDDDQVPSPCTASGDCSARCYLDALADVCAPTAAELSAFADCASHCVL